LNWCGAGWNSAS